MRDVLSTLAVILSVGGLATAACAASADDFKAALAKAEAANKQAQRDSRTSGRRPGRRSRPRRRPPTPASSTRPSASPSTPRRLANASIAQAKEQEKLWPDAVIR